MDKAAFIHPAAAAMLFPHVQYPAALFAAAASSTTAHLTQTTTSMSSASATSGSLFERNQLLRSLGKFDFFFK